MECGEDVGGVVRWRGDRCEVVAVDADRHVAERPEGADDATDADARGRIEVSADREGCEHDSEMRMDRFRCRREHGPGAEIGLRHPERRLDLEQVVIRGHDLFGGDLRDGEVGDVALLIPSSA